MFALSVAVLSLLPGMGSAATITLTAGPFSPIAGVTNTSFDSGTLPVNFVALGPMAGVTTGTSALAAAPNGDSTPYAFVGSGSSITATFLGGVTYLGLYWGSPDSYNALALTDSNAVTTTYGLGGIAIPGLNNPNVSQYVNFFSTGAAFTSAKFTSSSSAFEFDNVATATPEPASFALAAGSLLALCLGSTRRRKE